MQATAIQPTTSCCPPHYLSSRSSGLRCLMIARRMFIDQVGWKLLLPQRDYEYYVHGFGESLPVPIQPTYSVHQEWDVRALYTCQATSRTPGDSIGSIWQQHLRHYRTYRGHVEDLFWYYIGTQYILGTKYKILYSTNFAAQLALVLSWFWSWHISSRLPAHSST